MIEERIAVTCCEAVKNLYGKEIDITSVSIQKTKKEFAGDFTIVVFPFSRLA